MSVPHQLPCVGLVHPILSSPQEERSSFWACWVLALHPPPNVFSVGLQIQLGLGGLYDLSLHPPQQLASKPGRATLRAVCSPCKVSAPSGQRRGTVGDGVKLQEEEAHLGNGPSPRRPRLSPGGWPRSQQAQLLGTCTLSACDLRVLICTLRG